ncbi:MAG: ABC transporter substrate-binding protein, partial [Actinobacteria bacterium]
MGRSRTPHPPRRRRATHPHGVRDVRRLVACVGFAVAATSSGCATEVAPVVVATTTTTAIPGPPTGRVVVLAATPIAPAVERLAGAFTQLNPGVEVVVTPGSAKGLVNQVAGGLMGDVFVSIGRDAVDLLAIDGHLAAEPLVFGSNPLVLVVPPGNPEAVAGLADLADPNRAVALCSLDSACGKAADSALMRAGLTVSPEVLATDGETVVEAIATGRASVGLAYRTDATAAVSSLALDVDLRATV